MSDDETCPGAYVLGETRDADDNWVEAQDALWTSGGFGGPAITDLLGLSSPHRVTGRQALEQAAALICLDVLSQDISKATLRLKETVRGGGRIDVDPNSHPVARMLALEPSPRHTWTEFVGMLVYHLCLSSNSYTYVKRNVQGDALQLVPVMPARTGDPLINEQTGELFYEISAGNLIEKVALGAWDIKAPERDVIHVRQRMIDGFLGYSTLVAGGRTLSLNRDLINYEQRLFSEDALIRGVFVRDGDKGEMTDAVFRRMKSQLKKLMHRVRDHGDPILLEDGVTYQELGMKANEAEMAKALDSQIEMICKLWRMPPHKAMHLAAVKYENLATLEMVYVRDTLIPLCRLIEARFAKTLLTEQERLRFTFEFDRDEMAIADEKAEGEEAIKLAERGFISHDEVRAARRYNPRPKGHGKVYTVPANVKIVDEEGNTIVTGAKETTQAPADQNAPSEDDAKPAKGLKLVANN
jgi:HK97 family phage portal protein